MIKRLYQNFLRACNYFIHGWNSYDWDYNYLLDDLQFKLQRMSSCIEKNNIIENAPILAAEVRAAATLIYRIKDDNYLDSVYAELRQKHGVRVDWFEKAKKIDPKFGQCYAWKHKNVKTSDMDKSLTEEQYIKDFKRLTRKSRKLRQKDIELLFKYIAEHIEEWWD